jgi:hypothetical protein
MSDTVVFTSPWGKRGQIAGLSPNANGSLTTLARERRCLSYYSAIALDALNTHLDLPIPCRIPIDT